MVVQETDIVFEHGEYWSELCVIIPLYNYDKYIVETLNSVVSQVENDISLVIVDDCSTDSSVNTVKEWLSKNSVRFRRSIIAKNVRNSGLSITRNTGICISDSKFLFFLDADNLIYPRCLSRHLAALKANADAQGAYSLLEVFDGEAGIMGAEVFDRDRFMRGNHIDAMALIRRDFLSSVGGYHNIKHGWEDYDLWLRMCESGEFLVQIPEILGRYRVHRQSMLRTTTNVGKNHAELRENIMSLHPWLVLD